jgi:hypothetical protein
VPEPISYQLATIQDIFDKVPANRIRDCTEELGVLLSQAAATRDLFAACAEEIGLSRESAVPKLPEFFTWVDDGKGELAFKVVTKSAEGDPTPVFSIDTHVNQK